MPLDGVILLDNVKAKYLTRKALYLFLVLEEDGSCGHLQPDVISGLLRCIVFVNKLLGVIEHPWINVGGIWLSSAEAQVFVERAVNLWSTGVSLLLTLITQVYNFNYSF